jgi:hypothetical protein
MIALMWWCTSLAHAVEGTVTVPLAALEAVEDGEPSRPPSHQLSRAVWAGAVDPGTGAIELDATLEASLTGDGYKSVPLLGRDAVLREVQVDGRPVPVDVVDGFHTWHTTREGSAVVRVRGWIPASGERGSLEHDVPIPATPSTRVVLTLPQRDLRPEVRDAVRVDVRNDSDSTVLTADLRPTDRLHVLGLRDLASEDGRAAELYAQTSHLVSVTDHRIEVFAVVRYSILYGSTDTFEVLVPEGLAVVEADGEGGLSTELEEVPEGTLVRGHTRHPIRNHSELSLRLQRGLPAGTHELPLPRARAVEREHGWVGLEVPGRVQLTDRSGGEMQRLPIQQLPAEVREASVSPILDAWRLDTAPRLFWEAARLPEVEVSSERIDQVQAHTVVAAGGRVVTELSLRLQNRSRHGLTLALPEGTSVTRATRDDQPVVPAAGDEGVLLPLRRTGAGESQQLTVLLAHDADALGWWGRTELALPELDLPVAALDWQVHLPESHHWLALHSDVRAQTRVGSGSWLAEQPRVGGAPASSQALPAPDTSDTRRYTRFWIDAHTPVRATVPHVAPWLWGLGRLLLLGLVGLGATGLAAWRWLRR